jgi:hypothetical protein
MAGMADDELRGSPDERHPVVSGLLALLAVCLVVGLILGGAALAATQVLGVGDDETATDESTAGPSLFLPRPERTGRPDGPLVTLNSTDEEEGGGAEETESSKPESEPTESESDKSGISLSAGQTAVGPMEPIDLTGVYPGGEGAILQVQQFTAGRWDDFPVTTPVSNETFTTYIQTSQPGLNRFRMIDTKSGRTSNEVRVRIG